MNEENKTSEACVIPVICVLLINAALVALMIFQGRLTGFDTC